MSTPQEPLPANFREGPITDIPTTITITHCAYGNTSGLTPPQVLATYTCHS